MENFNSTVKLKVVGVGGAGGNAINDMIESNITTVEFVAINTDQQDLDRSKATSKVLLGRGTGAGADPEKGRSAARDSEDKIKEVLEGTDMLFITAGMGGGTGTGASPIIAEVAKSMGILTVAIVTKPFSFEGPIKKNNALAGIKNLKENVDTLIAIPNDKLFEIPGMNITLLNAFKEANSILKIGIKGISDLIMKQGVINLDFADIRSIMQNSGIAMLGFGEANGDEKAKSATTQALNSPLLEKSIEGARKILINITAGPDVSLNEINEVANTVTAKAGSEPNLIWGYILEEELEGTISVSIVATDFQDNVLPNLGESDNVSKTVRFAPEEKKVEEPNLKDLFGSIDTSKLKEDKITKKKEQPKEPSRKKPEKVQITSQQKKASDVINALTLDQVAKTPKSQMTGEYNEYFGMISRILQSKWSAYKADSTDEAEVEIVIGIDGTFSYDIKKLSYNSEFNNKVRDFLQSMTFEKFPPPTQIGRAVRLGTKLEDKLE